MLKWLRDRLISLWQWTKISLPFSTKITCRRRVLNNGVDIGSHKLTRVSGNCQVTTMLEQTVTAGGVEVKTVQRSIIASNGMPISVEGGVRAKGRIIRFHILFTPDHAAVFNPDDLRDLPSEIPIPELVDSARKDLLWFFTHFPAPGETYTGVEFNWRSNEWVTVVTHHDENSPWTVTIGGANVSAYRIWREVGQLRQDSLVVPTSLGAQKGTDYIVRQVGGHVIEFVDERLTDADLVEIRQRMGVKIPEPSKSDPANPDPTSLDPTSLDPTRLDPTSLDPTSLDPTSLDGAASRSESGADPSPDAFSEPESSSPSNSKEV